MRRRDRGHRGAGPVRWLAVLLVLALASVAGVALRYDVRTVQDARELAESWFDAAPEASGPAEVEPPQGLELPDPAAPRPVAAPVDPAAPVDRRAVRRVLGARLTEEQLGDRVVAAVAGLESGDPVFARGLRKPVIPASTMKLLTVAAALEVLGAHHTFRTRVVQGAKPQQIVLVGGGDPLLAGAEPSPTERRALYPARADVQTLARATAAALTAQGRDRVRLRYDTSLFSGPRQSPHWRADYIPDGIVSPITALWVDQGRHLDRPGRVADPALAAAASFAAALQDAGIRVLGVPVEQAAPPGATELAAVESAPVGQIAQRILDVSDNEAAEVLAHHVGLAVRGEGSFAAGAAGVVATLRGLGVRLDRDRVYDGSGLSRENRLTAQTLLEVLRLGVTRPALREVLTGLPVAGFTGSLTSRFDSGPPAGRGRVRAKTGTLTGVHGLAGTAVGLDGTPMVFVLLADRVAVEDTLAARRTLDELAAGLGACRCAG